MHSGLYVNDVPLYDYSRFTGIGNVGSRGLLDNSIANEIRVFPGNPPIEYGNVTSGLVAYATDPKVEDDFEVSLSLANLSVNGGVKLGENISIKGFSNHQVHPLWKLFNASAFNNINRFISSDLGLQIFSNLKRYEQIKLLIYGINEKYNFLNETPSYSANADFNNRRTFNIFNYKYQKGRFVYAVNSGFSQGANQFDFENTDVKESRRYLYLAGNANYLTDVWRAGLGVTYENRRFMAQGLIPEKSYAQFPKAPVIELDTALTTVIPEYYAYFQIRLFNFLTVGTGGRQGITTAKKDRYASAQLNLRIDLNKKYHIKIGNGFYNRFLPPQTNLFDDPPIRSTQNSISATRKTKESEINFSVFRNHLENTENSVITNITGLEFLIKHYFKEIVTASLSFSSLINETLDGNDNNFNPNPHIPNFIRLNATYNLPKGISIGSNFIYRNGSLYTPVISTLLDENQLVMPVFGEQNSLRCEDYLRLDLCVNKITFFSGNRTVVFFQILNVLNTRNVRAIQYNRNYSSLTFDFFKKETFILAYNLILGVLKINFRESKFQVL